VNTVGQVFLTLGEIIGHETAVNRGVLVRAIGSLPLLLLLLLLLLCVLLRRVEERPRKPLFLCIRAGSLALPDVPMVVNF